MQFSRALRALPVVFWLGPAAPDASLAAQARYRITTDGAWFFQEAGGKRLARLARGAQVAGGDARGDWLAVTLEGWIFATSVGPTPRAGFDLAVTRTPEEELRAEPQRYVGQVLRWTLQFIAVQKADELRPDIPNGATYLLARGPLPERGFVYVVVPDAKRALLDALTPLATVQVTARVRAGRTRFLGNPVLDLMSLETLP